MLLSDQELLRYDRQITLKGFDIDKQQCLKQAKALIIGVGGLGCAASVYLASAGIGYITLVDFDTISISNLSRQILYQNSSVGRYKVDVAKLQLQTINPNLSIHTIKTQLDDTNLIAEIVQHDVVLDCSDNLSTREQLNQCCFISKKPLISGAAIRMEGLLTTFTYQNKQPCYQCLSALFGTQQLTCVEAGVMTPLVGMIGTLQAIEAIKVVTQYGAPLIGRLLMIDAMSMQFNEFTFKQQPNCPTCHGTN